MKIQEERGNPFFPIKKNVFLLIIFLFVYIMIGVRNLLKILPHLKDFFRTFVPKIKKIMATITLEYNSNNLQAKKALDNLLSLGIFTAQKGKIQSQKSFLERRKKLDRELNKYLIDLSEFKFNRDEANDYE